MTIRNLAPLLRPSSLALIGASDRPGSLGNLVLENVLDAGFAGPISVVTLHPFERSGIHCVRSVDDLGEPADLAIIMTPAQTVPQIIGQLGRLGTKCAVVVSSGLTTSSGLQQAMLDEARPHLLRVIGPNCLGVVSPRAKLDATFARTKAKPGRLALISQSGALITAMLDWADARGIGFSGIVSAGDMADVDLGDLIDLFATDPETDAILLYVEGVSHAAKFLSAARAAAILKPVVAIKAGRSPAAAKAAFSHTGALAGSDEVYHAAFERVGIVMVETLTELFDAAQTLCLCKGLRGDRLGIVTNGGGAGILAVDALTLAGGRLAEMSGATLASLDAVLPRGWSRANPVDLIGDGGPARYAAAIPPMLRDDNIDALLVMNCPTGRATSAAFAAATVGAVDAARCEGPVKPVLACWLGDTNAAETQGLMEKAEIPLFSAPEDAVGGFRSLIRARRARTSLTDRPAATREVKRDLDRAKRILANVRGQGRTQLTPLETKELLTAYGIGVAASRFVADASAVEAACRSLKPPFVVKIASPDLSHKSEVGGVVLNLVTAAAAAAAARDMADRLARERPAALIAGFVIEEMIARVDAFELLAGIASDETFGPLVLIGAGGTAVEIVADKALSLAPIDHAEALDLIDRTTIAKRLKGYRNVRACDLDAVAGVLDALSAMTIDLPDILELDINPLLANYDGVIALDARVRLSPEPLPHPRHAILPVPVHWSADLVTRDGVAIHVRPVRADDEPLLAEFFKHVSPEDLRFRFLSGVGEVGHDKLAMMTRVDYRRTITFLAFAADPGTVIATAMLAAEPDRSKAEVALATRADARNSGVSWTLFEHALRYAQAEKIAVVEAIEYADHDAAIRMEKELGFVIESDPEDPTLRIATRSL